MAKFLSRHELYRLLQRELPEGAYPDGPPDRYYSTADMDSVAAVAASGYANLERIYDNYFPQTADESMADWETKVFGSPLDSSISLQARRDAVLIKIRNPYGIRKSDMVNVVKSVIGTDKLVEIIEWGCRDGAWILDYSELDISTYLGGADLMKYPGISSCEKPAGLTTEEWIIYQEEAYTYDVLIYEYTLTAAQREEIERQLGIEEPARSRHFIYDNLDEADMISGED